MKLKLPQGGWMKKKSKAAASSLLTPTQNPIYSKILNCNVLQYILNTILFGIPLVKIDQWFNFFKTQPKIGQNDQNHCSKRSKDPPPPLGQKVWLITNFEIRFCTFGTF